MKKIDGAARWYATTLRQKKVVNVKFAILNIKLMMNYVTRVHLSL